MLLKYALPTLPGRTEAREGPKVEEATHAALTGSKSGETSGEGLIYHEPQRSFATSGRAKVVATVSVKRESERMERSRLRVVGGGEWEWVLRGRREGLEERVDWGIVGAVVRGRVMVCERVVWWSGAVGNRLIRQGFCYMA